MRRRAADVTLEVVLRKNEVRGRGGISSAGALFTAEGRQHLMHGRTATYRGSSYYFGGAVETEKCA